MKRFVNTRKRKMLATFAACVVAAITAGVFAAWLAPPSQGPATGKAGNLQAVTVTAGTLPGSPSTCFPDGSCAGYVTLSNPNSTAVKLSNLEGPSGAGAGTVTVTGANGVACTTGEISNEVSLTGGIDWAAYFASYPTPADITVPAQVGGTPGTKAVTLPNLWTFSSIIHNDCQNATFTKKIALTLIPG